MFTGLIQSIGFIRSLSLAQNCQDGLHLTIEYDTTIHSLEVGDSIAINGVCQTVEVLDDNSFVVFAIPETLSCTNFSYFSVGDEVNLEDPLTLQKKISGHLVQGHVEGVAKVCATVKKDNVLDVLLSYDSPYLLPKGSVTLDGISLTVQTVQEEHRFTVQIIPETIRRTNISSWAEGSLVNIETDYLVKSVHLISSRKS